VRTAKDVFITAAVRVLALVAKALHFAYSRVGEDSAKEMLRNAVEEAISSIEELDFRPPPLSSIRRTQCDQNKGGNGLARCRVGKRGTNDP
jgi:hypothetical protein